MQQEVLSKLKRAIEAERADTTAAVGFEDRVALTGSGSWTGSHSVTWGELELLVDAVEAASQLEQPMVILGDSHATRDGYEVVRYHPFSHTLEGKTIQEWKREAASTRDAGEDTLRL